MSHDAKEDHAIDICNHDWSYHRSSGATIARSQDATIARTIGRRMQRSIDRTIGRRSSRLILHRSLIPNNSRTISYDGTCHRYSPIVHDSVTTRIDRSRYATAARDSSKHCRSVAPWPNRNQSYDPEIVRSGVTGALSRQLSVNMTLTTIETMIPPSKKIVQLYGK